MAPSMYLVLGTMALTGFVLTLAWSLDLVTVTRSDVRDRVVPTQRTVKTDDVEVTGFAGGRPSLGIRRLWVLPANITKLERSIAQAGKSPKILPTVLVLKLVAPLMWAFIGSTMVGAIGGGFMWVFFWVGLVAAYMYPDIYLTSRAVERKAEMERALPDVLEQITIALDAGMSFEAAFARVGSTHRGPLGPQITRTVQDMAVGVARRDAYLALAERNDIPDLRRFVKSLVQAEEFGVPISQVVRLIAEEMRDKRRQRAAATAKTIPLKLLFPMMSCLLPVLFIIMLTPAVISLGDSL